MKELESKHRIERLTKELEKQMDREAVLKATI
jgi:hypothetical protein